MSDAYTVLIAGSRNVDAGKTTVATGLIEYGGAVGLKPRAGNDYWYDYDSVAASLAEGRLVGKDAQRLASASTPDIPAEELNPIHRLWRPTSGSGAIFGREGSEFLVDRVGDTFVRNAEADLPSDVRALLAEDVVAVDTLAEMNRIMRAHHQPALEDVKSIIEDHDRVVIESYSDVARPLRDVAIDAVVVVGAGTLELYDGERYCRAGEVASGGPELGQLEERVADVTGLIKPLERRQLAPLGHQERSDPAAVASAYAETYDAVLDAVE